MPPPLPPPPLWQPQSIAKQKTKNKTTTTTTVINNPPQNPLKTEQHPLAQQLKPRKHNQNPLALATQSHETTSIANPKPRIHLHWQPKPTSTGNPRSRSHLTSTSMPTIKISTSMPMIVTNTPISPQHRLISPQRQCPRRL